MTYQRPKQSRAEQTEKRILDAYGQLLLLQSYHDTTVDQVADAASVSHGAFMTRFGSKRNALGRLFELFCDDVYLVLDRLRKASSPVNAKILDYLMSVSKEYEALVILHWGANRAMHEIFLKEGVIDDQTKGIFKATVAALHPKFCEILQQDLPIERSFAAIQLMVTVNYNHVLGAMPGLPQKDDERHGLIGETMVAALQ